MSTSQEIIMENKEGKTMGERLKALADARPEYKWKIQTANNGYVSCVAYVDARIVQDLLDEHLGAENWRVEYQMINGGMFCSLSIRTENGWMTKTDIGTESSMEKKKGEVSDAFKRAAVVWGCCRFLYSLSIQKFRGKDVGSKQVTRQGKSVTVYYLQDEQKNEVYDVHTFVNNRIKAKEGNKEFDLDTFYKLATCGKDDATILAALKKYSLTKENKKIINMLLPNLVL